MLLTVNNINKSFGENVIFENVSFGIDEHDKIGFVGSNGAGKSTLFKILTGELINDDGDIFKNKNLEIGYLSQHSCADSDKSVFEETLLVFKDLTDLEEEIDNIRYEIEKADENMNYFVERQHRLSEEFEQNGGFTYKSRTKAVLKGLGFSENDLKLSVNLLSGGQKTRVALAKILLSGANLLLLDEPTNHLDIESVEWLENFLKSYNGAFIVISHDRYFLDKVTNKTFELEGGRFYSMNGSYSEFAAQRDIDKFTEERNYANTMREIERLNKIVEQQRRWNREKNIKTAESKQKVIKKLKETLVEPLQSSEEANFRFTACSGGGDNALIAEGLKKSFDEKVLFDDINIHIKRGERIFIVGPNGCGKTTLLKILIGQLKADKGEYKIGANTFLGYYDQLQESLNLNKTVLDEVWDTYPEMTQTVIRNALAAFLFKNEDVYKEIKTLSGGERARVELVKLILKKVNFLIMDEPTNHLDIQSREALEKALTEYDGTLLMVSHDRYFINSIATRILRLDEKGIVSYDGNYDDYIQKYESIDKPTEEKVVSQSSISYKEQKRIESEKRKLKTKFLKTEEEIFNTEEEIDRLNEELQSPEIALDYIKAAEITEKIAEENKKLEQLYILWDEIQQEMEE